MKFLPYYVIYLLVSLTEPVVVAQDSLEVCDKVFCKSSVIPIPLVYYTPETRLAGGAAVLYAFRFRGQAGRQRPSQVRFGVAYTQNKQVLLYLPFLFFSKGEAFRVDGELGYYKYIYQLFGIGNETPKSTSEYYDADYPRLRINGLYQFSPNWYAGIRYWWDDYKIPRRDSAGLLIENTVTGHSGGVISGGGPLLTYDSRDHIFFPSKGLFIETEFYINKKYFGSDFNFTRFSLDAKAYISDNRKGVWALNVYLVSLSGKPPFQQLALLGGAKRMRGYFEGRYRDRNLWMFQAEYRFPLYRRTGGVAFGGVGNVSPSVQTLFSQKVHLTFGAGVRILLAEKDHINLRFDVGANEQGEVFPYLTVAEAF